MVGVADAMVQEDSKLKVEVASQFRTSTFCLLTIKYLSSCIFALSLAKNNVNPIDKAQEHSMSIKANSLT